MDKPFSEKLKEAMDGVLSYEEVVYILAENLGYKPTLSAVTFAAQRRKAQIELQKLDEEIMGHMTPEERIRYLRNYR